MRERKQLCYNCKFFVVAESKEGIKCSCKCIDNALVGAIWCRYYKPTKPVVR
ncbi:MAG: hypothetical protein IK100_09575 [Muribaculaceae bacterium]|nr:hypothetical protein [Muribaculaceae bacterium]